MQQKLNGTVELEGEVIPSGAKIECFIDGAWYYGVLHQDRSTKKYIVMDWKGGGMLERIDSLTARIRKQEED